jgi:O-acetyl-ADP-ribose deacetylase (regulator of RNase III)
MGKGIAVEFRRRFPEMYEEYKKRCQEGRFVLGDVFAWSAHDGTTVFNLGTQRTWRAKAELPAIRVAISRMIKLAREMGVLRIGLPRIGAGLGGLPWKDVKNLLVYLGSSTHVELRVFEEFVPTASGPG